MSDAVAAAIAALNQRLKALTDAIKEVNETLGKGEADDDRGSSDARSDSG